MGVGLSRRAAQISGRDDTVGCDSAPAQFLQTTLRESTLCDVPASLFDVYDG